MIMNKIKWLSSGMFLLPLVVQFRLSAQNFNYSFSSSTGTYQEISGAELAAGEQVLAFTKKAAIGFPFTYLGQRFDSLIVSSNGYIAFDDNFNYGFAYLGNPLQNSQDTLAANASAAISYELTGTTNNRILKLQFKNCSFLSSSIPGVINFQVWLYEQGNRIELRTGSTNYPYDLYTSVKPVIGLINMNYDGSGTLGYLLYGSGNTPQAKLVSSTNAIDNTDNLAASGRVYTFNAQ